jgi:hypothetical protein
MEYRIQGGGGITVPAVFNYHIIELANYHIYKKSTPPLRRMLTKEFLFQYHSTMIPESFLCFSKVYGN